MASQTSGILRWTSSVRNSMINDPGRQFFEDQVQSQGFLFLDEYLDNIWAAAKQDSFVDLVKTPGRKRASPQKARQVVAVNATSMALSDEKDVFLCDDVKSSPPPPPTTIESSDHIVGLHPQFRGSHSTIIERTEVAPQPLPSAPSAPSMFMDLTVPLKDKEDGSASVVVRNPSLEQFPSLTAPSPLRKSIRHPRESSLEPSLTTTPGTSLTGNHTSWLAKVREAKAMEVMNKRASVVPSTLVPPSGGVKRKSGELPCGLTNDGDNGEERKVKILKMSVDITEAAIHLEPQSPEVPSLQLSVTDVHAERLTRDVTTPQMDSENDMMAPLKKAIEALRARTGKSLAGNVTDMNVQGPPPVDFGVEVVHGGLPQPQTLRPSLSAPIPIRGKASSAAVIRAPTPPMSSQPVAGFTIVPPLREDSKRLSVSDLVPKHGSSNAASRTSSNETSISTTPPDSPPATKKTAFFVPGGPVFNKPPPVFVPPPTMKPDRSPADVSAKVPKAHTSQVPGYLPTTPFGLGLQPTKLPKSPPRGPFSAQSTQSSSVSDSVFGTQDDVHAWMPRSQDTQITSQGSHPVDEVKKHPADIDDDDDSWPIDGKFGATNAFAGIAAVEDSMTWSTAPSESQVGSQSPRQDSTGDAVDAAIPSHRSQIGSDESDEDMDVDEDVMRDVLDEGKPTASLVTANHAPTKSQQSVVSSSGDSSQPVGFFGHATKLVSSMLGVNKKNNAVLPKSIQLAAAAAKKQQEEQDRKAARLKDMEARRQALLQKKAEEDKLKADEGEKKTRDDAERRKKEREENTGQRPLVRAESKLAEEDNAKKRKVTVEVPKVKPPSKEKKDAPPTRITKPGQISNSKTTTVTKQSSTTSLKQSTNVKALPTEKPVIKSTPASASTKGKSKTPAVTEDTQSKKISQSQTQTVVRANPQRPNVEPPIASEMIELPEPNSEYSDSEDESRKRKKNDAPEWTQSPELRAALESQSRVNPDDIFGPVRPLRMEDIFRTRTSRFRARTSSANWSGPDGLRQEEEREYARRMGFQ